MGLVINDDNLRDCEVEEFSRKVRAILVDEDNKILIANYYNLILLPGGKVEDNESIYTAIRRELKEETGKDYSEEELELFEILNYYQKNYLTRNEVIRNRLVQIYYFIGKYKGVKQERQKLTESEQKANFRLELVPLYNIEKIIKNNKNDNPRNIYFQKELLTILELYKTRDKVIKKQKKELL